MPGKAKVFFETQEVIVKGQATRSRRNNESRKKPDPRQSSEQGSRVSAARDEFLIHFTLQLEAAKINQLVRLSTRQGDPGPKVNNFLSFPFQAIGCPVIS